MSIRIVADVPLGTIVRTIRPALLSCLLSLSCTPSSPAPPTVPDQPVAHQLTQVSVINALMIGRYDGVMSIGDLSRHGDFGVGTLDHLDGELILLDGKAYQVRGDGAVIGVHPGRSTPFAVVTKFEQDGELPSPLVASLAELDARLDIDLPQKNGFVAIRVDGQFKSLKLRSVHRQEPPYRPLAEVAKSQSVWTHGDVTGSLIGIRCPRWVEGLNVPGYHWHFLSDNRKVGGHVLDCSIRAGRLRYDVCHDWLIKLDTSAEVNAVDLGQDLSRDVRRVESARDDETPQ